MGDKSFAWVVVHVMIMMMMTMMMMVVVGLQESTKSNETLESNSYRQHINTENGTIIPTRVQHRMPDTCREGN